MKFSDNQVKDWLNRHCLDLSVVDGRSAMEDAATTKGEEHTPDAKVIPKEPDPMNRHAWITWYRAYVKPDALLSECMKANTEARERQAVHPSGIPPQEPRLEDMVRWVRWYRIHKNPGCTLSAAVAARSQALADAARFGVAVVDFRLPKKKSKKK